VGSTGSNLEPQYYNSGKLKFRVIFPGRILNEGIYTFSRILLVKDRGHVLMEWSDLLTFEMLPVNKGALGWQGNKEGVIRIDDLKWEIKAEDGN
jgi:hypothetical protein